jgi:hypothetical protein
MFFRVYFEILGCNCIPGQSCKLTSGQSPSSLTTLEEGRRLAKFISASAFQVKTVLRKFFV